MWGKERARPATVGTWALTREKSTSCATALKNNATLGAKGYRVPRCSRAMSLAARLSTLGVSHKRLEHSRELRLQFLWSRDPDRTGRRLPRARRRETGMGLRFLGLLIYRPRVRRYASAASGDKPCAAIIASRRCRNRTSGMLAISFSLLSAIST